MTTDSSSRWPGFYKLPLGERVERVAALGRLRPESKQHFEREGRLPARVADHMVENCIGTFELPLGLGMNLRVDDRDRVVPMAIEEPSVVAGLGRAARLLREGRGIESRQGAPVMIGQIQILDVADPEAAKERLLAAKDELLEKANDLDRVLVRVGGGAKDMTVRILPPEGQDDPVGTMVVVHLYVDVRDAMGANAVNTMAERLAPRVAEIAGGRVLLRILSNLADQRVVTVTGRVAVARLDPEGDPERGLAIALGIQEASVFAERDPYRAATHNKGTMNGIDAVLVAVGQDWRAVEAGAHAYAARDGRYRSLTRWRVKDGVLEGTLAIPMAVGTVGGVTRDHPAVRAALDLIDVKSGAELAALVAAVGLAQNLAAISALATDGIQRGHMRLHARKIGAVIGATEAEQGPLFDELHRRGCWSEESARSVLDELRRTRGTAAEQASPDSLAASGGHGERAAPVALHARPPR